MLFIAPWAVLALEPPCAIDNAVVKPLRLVMSLLAPLAAAPRLLRAVAALLALVPPLATDRGEVKVRPAKVGVDVVAIFWMVLTAPLLTVKFVALKLAMPLAT